MRLCWVKWAFKANYRDRKEGRERNGGREGGEGRRRVRESWEGGRGERVREKGKEEGREKKEERKGGRDGETAQRLNNLENLIENRSILVKL